MGGPFGNVRETFGDVIGSMDLMLVADPSPFHGWLWRLLDADGYDVRVTNRRRVVDAWLATTPPAAQLLVVVLPAPEGQGLEFIRAARAKHPPNQLSILAVILETETADPSRARLAGATATLRVPFDEDDLNDALGECLTPIIPPEDRPSPTADDLAFLAELRRRPRPRHVRTGQFGGERRDEPPTPPGPKRPRSPR